MTDPKITKAIKKLASGYSVSEVTEDFAVEDGEFHVVKKRRTKKEIPPDMKAIMFLLENEDLSGKSEEELEREREMLENLLKEAENNG